MIVTNNLISTQWMDGLCSVPRVNIICMAFSDVVIWNKGESSLMLISICCQFSCFYTKSNITQIHVNNMLQLLYIIAHEIIVSNSVSEYTHGPWKISGACSLMMSFHVNRTSTS